jgi:putative sugar O-methyltransferase
MPTYPELDRAWQDMPKQDPLYQTTEFWRDASEAIMDEITTEGIDQFRHLGLPLDYFVPTYGSPGNGFQAAQVADLAARLGTSYPNEPKTVAAINKLLSGEASALADYRVFMAGDRKDRAPDLQKFSESSFGGPIEHFTFDGRNYSRSSLNYILGLTLLKTHLNGEVPRTVLEIGGGFGSLGEILVSSGVEGLRYIDIDIPPMNYVAESYLRAAIGETRVTGYGATAELKEIEISALPSASCLCAWQIERLRGEVDLFVNFISFQEMEPVVVRNYLERVSRLKSKWIMLRNMREGKQRKKDGEVGVLDPILGEEYLKMLPDYSLVDSNVIPYGFRTIDNFHSELLILKRRP